LNYLHTLSLELPIHLIRKEIQPKLSREAGGFSWSQRDSYCPFEESAAALLASLEQPETTCCYLLCQLFLVHTAGRKYTRGHLYRTAAQRLLNLPGVLSAGPRFQVHLEVWQPTSTQLGREQCALPCSSRNETSVIPLPLCTMTHCGCVAVLSHLSSPHAFSKASLR